MPHIHKANPSISQIKSRLALALVITLIFVVIEALAGLAANSLALLTDAAHNLTDVAALALSWFAVLLASRPASASRTFGYHRAGILIALLNAISLGVITLWIFYEAYQRFVSPPVVDDQILIAMAVLAFIVNAGTAWLIHAGSQSDLSLRSAFIHLAGDAVSSLGALAAGIAIAFTGAYILDSLVSVMIGIFILWNAWKIVRESVDILLESTPTGLSMQSLVHDLLETQGVRSIHDLHVWSINQEMRALSVHVLTEDVSISQGAETQLRINEMLRGKYNITHTTLQLECAGCEPDHLYCNLTDGNNHGARPAIQETTTASPEE